MKKKRSADFCGEQTDVITNFAVIKRLHCIFFAEKKSNSLCLASKK